MGRNALAYEIFRKRIGVLRAIEEIIKRGEAGTMKDALAVVQEKCTPELTGLPEDFTKAYQVIRRFKSNNNPNKIKSHKITGN